MKPLSIWTLCVIVAPSCSWIIPLKCRPPSTTLILQAQRQSRSKEAVVVEDDKPAGIEGAQFFGGNKQKEEFYDPQAEETAILETSTKLNRFENRQAFPTEQLSRVAECVQSQVNEVLYSDFQEPVLREYQYSENLQWNTPFAAASSATTPLAALSQALEFYRRVDVAITSATSVGANTNLRWEMSVVWPTLWSPRVVLTGTSLLTLQGNRIVQQVDQLDHDLSLIAQQIVPRFWDLYHIGMTPSAELSPRIKQTRLFASYQVFDVPSRWYIRATQLDLGTRQDQNARIVPNHAFSCVIKTMGPTRQVYVPTSPVQVQLMPTVDGLQLVWLIPMAVEYTANSVLPLPGADEEQNIAAQPSCEYVWQPARRVATVPYGGGPQDAEIVAIRQRLFEQVVKDGLRPKVDDKKRPLFFFWQNAIKACYTEEGLGMAVYEWRPEVAKSSEVGIELEL